MRVLLVSQDFPPDVGGIQTYSWEIARRLPMHFEDVVVVAPRRPGDESVDSQLGIPVHRLRARPDVLPLAALGRLPFLVRRHRIDVSFHAQWQTAGAALLSRRLTGYPRRIVVAAHGRELLYNPLGRSPAAKAYDALRRRVLAGIDLLLPVSRYTAGLAARVAEREVPVRIIHNGTDAERFRPVDAQAFRARIGADGRPLLLFVGRLVERKGVASTIDAVARLRESVPNVLFAVAGDGPDRERLERRVDSLSLQNNVRFLGEIPYDTLPEVYSAADVFVMPSTDEEPDVEGFGIVFLEANACGTAVVGARSGGIPDAIVDGETGLLVPPDDPRALAAVLERLIEDQSLRERLGAGGRARVLKDLTWDHVAERVAESLLEIR